MASNRKSFQLGKRKSDTEQPQKQDRPKNRQPARQSDRPKGKPTGKPTGTPRAEKRERGKQEEVESNKSQPLTGTGKPKRVRPERPTQQTKPESKRQQKEQKSRTTKKKVGLFGKAKKQEEQEFDIQEEIDNSKVGEATFSDELIGDAEQFSASLIEDVKGMRKTRQSKPTPIMTKPESEVSNDTPIQEKVGNQAEKLIALTERKPHFNNPGLKTDNPLLEKENPFLAKRVEVKPEMEKPRQKENRHKHEIEVPEKKGFGNKLKSNMTKSRERGNKTIRHEAEKKPNRFFKSRQPITGYPKISESEAKMLTTDFVVAQNEHAYSHNAFEEKDYTSVSVFKDMNSLGSEDVVFTREKKDEPAVVAPTTSYNNESDFVFDNVINFDNESGLDELGVDLGEAEDSLQLNDIEEEISLFKQTPQVSELRFSQLHGEEISLDNIDLDALLGDDEEEPVIEEPIIEEPIIEEPIEEPVIEEPVIEEPLTEEDIEADYIVENNSDVDDIEADYTVQALSPDELSEVIEADFTAEEPDSEDDFEEFSEEDVQGIADSFPELEEAFQFDTEPVNEEPRIFSQLDALTSEMEEPVRLTLKLDEEDNVSVELPEEFLDTDSLEDLLEDNDLQEDDLEDNDVQEDNLKEDDLEEDDLEEDDLQDDEETLQTKKNSEEASTPQAMTSTSETPLTAENDSLTDSIERRAREADSRNETDTKPASIKLSKVFNEPKDERKVFGEENLDDEKYEKLELGITFDIRDLALEKEKRVNPLMKNKLTNDLDYNDITIINQYAEDNELLNSVDNIEDALNFID